jgi:CxxC motif-containing protein (DUF1111 family)
MAIRRPRGVVALLAAATAAFIAAFSFAVEGQTGATEAPAGFDNKTNGFLTQADFDAARATFEERDEIADGLGPVYNAQSCAECHQNPVTGGVSQITELRAGHRDFSGNFVDAPGGSLINDRAINARIQEHVPNNFENVRTLRLSTNTLGLGFVEAISSFTLIDIANNQPGQSGGQIAGQVIQVPVFEGTGASRVGRFGWKNQQASLLSFSADAYLNEIGITSRFLISENTSLGASVAGYDTVPDPEDTENDIDVFANFIRSTKVPPRDGALAATSDAIAGANLFNQIGCKICHVTTFTTLPAGTNINGFTFPIPEALGNKIIHPYSDFLLHDIGTGDGIVQNGGQSTANKLRTMPLWGVRTHDRCMHDGAALTLQEAILRHAGEATFVTNNYRALGFTQRNQIIAFLKSL